ncbi:MAG: putative nucleotidyltransferase substrate binding domain-containing protein, partial [bacterium]
FLRHLAGQVLLGRPPIDTLTWKFRRWLRLELPVIDLKKQALAPMVAAARILALDAGVRQTGTIPRLEAVAEQGLLPPQLAQAALRAYDHLMLLRIRQHFRQQSRGEEPSNPIALSELNPLRRRFLVEALETVMELQDHVFQQFGGVELS